VAEGWTKGSTPVTAGISTQLKGVCDSQLGIVDLNEFLLHQGANLETANGNLWTPMAVSEDGRVVGGWAYANLANFGWVLQIPKAFVCHTSPRNPDKGHTISISFPEAFNEHLAHGDLAGPCQDYQQ